MVNGLNEKILDESTKQGNIGTSKHAIARQKFDDQRAGPRDSGVGTTGLKEVAKKEGSNSTG